MAKRAGLRVRRRAISGLPVDSLDRGGETSRWVKEAFSALDKTGMTLFPTLFAYQLLFELEPV